MSCYLNKNSAHFVGTTHFLWPHLKESTTHSGGAFFAQRIKEGALSCQFAFSGAVVDLHPGLVVIHIDAE